MVAKDFKVKNAVSKEPTRSQLRNKCLTLLKIKVLHDAIEQ